MTEKVWWLTPKLPLPLQNPDDDRVFVLLPRAWLPWFRNQVQDLQFPQRTIGVGDADKDDAIAKLIDYLKEVEVSCVSEMRVDSGWIQFRCSPADNWQDVIEVSALQGADGADGADGQNGADGQPIELQAGETHLQYRVVGTFAWIDIIPLSALQGADGADGADGQNGFTPTPVWSGTSLAFDLNGNGTPDTSFVNLKGATGETGTAATLQGMPTVLNNDYGGTPNVCAGVKGLVDHFVERYEEWMDTQIKYMQNLISAAQAAQGLLELFTTPVGELLPIDEAMSALAAIGLSHLTSAKSAETTLEKQELYQEWLYCRISQTSVDGLTEDIFNDFLAFLHTLTPPDWIDYNMFDFLEHWYKYPRANDKFRVNSFNQDYTCEAEWTCELEYDWCHKIVFVGGVGYTVLGGVQGAGGIDAALDVFGQQSYNGAAFDIDLPSPATVVRVLVRHITTVGTYDEPSGGQSYLKFNGANVDIVDRGAFSDPYIYQDEHTEVSEIRFNQFVGSENSPGIDADGDTTLEYVQIWGLGSNPWGGGDTSCSS